jgi:hypothetical protein
MAFVPEWMKAFLFYRISIFSQSGKEARMTHKVQVNYIFWKQGPLLGCLSTFQAA